MSAWGASGYRAIGVYIGGTNMACAQPNLNSAWVSGQSAAGWHLIPIYVGLQAPGELVRMRRDLLRPRRRTGHGRRP